MAVNGDRESTQERRYLLGAAAEDERAAVEQRYFTDGDALERMEAAEEVLIEDYLADRLGSDERTLFERRYLTVPHRRRRVEMIRGLMSSGQRTPSATTRRLPPMEGKNPRKSHTVTGGGRTELHVVETGNPSGRPLLFIHGISQCWLTWSRQLNSTLADRYRLVAMDLRGHGLSQKPRDGYDDSKLWADDVDAVIESLKLEQPIVSGWSYGPLVILDYIRHYGDERLGAIHFIGGVTKLGSDEAMAILTPEFLSLVPGFCSADVQESVRSLTSLLRLCFAREPSMADLYLMLGYNVSVPPYVREALFARSSDNDDLLPRIRKPVLITHGARDAIVRPVAVEQHKAALPHAQIHVMPDVGHAAFWDDAAGFNERLRAFAETLP